MSGETVLSDRGGAGEAPAAADIDEKVHAEAVRRGLITPAQGSAALADARAKGRPLLDVLRERSLLTEEAAAALDEEVREDFIPGYRVLSKLGEGGMGVVYRALQKRLDRVVALKVVIPRLAADASYLKRFEREARAVARLNHPSIVAAYDYGESGGRVWLAMEFVEGINGAEEVRRNGPMAEDRALSVVRDVAAGLAHAHASGVLHRDIKPANILLAARRPGDTASGSATGAKVTDLGLARVADQAGTSELTAAGSILGTPGYMAPEQAFGREIDHRADIYALGATLYQLLTGQRPFEAPTPVAVIARQQSERLADPRDLRPGISEGAVALLQGMMAREPESRHAGYRELLRDIDRVLEGKAPLLPPPSPDRCSLAAPVAAVPGGTLELPAARGAATLLQPPPSAASPPAASPAAAPTPPPERRGIPRLPLVLVAAVAAVVAVIKFQKKPGDGPPPPGPEKHGTAPPAPAAPGGGEAEEPALAAIRQALDADDLPGALQRLVEAKRRLAAMPEAERRRVPGRAARMETFLARAREAAEKRVTDHWRKGEYAEGLALATRVTDLLGEEAGPGLEGLAATLASIGERGAAEREALRAASEARAKSDPLAALAALEGFAAKYEFSPDLVRAEETRAWAEAEAPEVTLRSDPPGATVLVAGRDRGRAPVTFRAAAGTLEVELRLEGHHPLSRTLTVARGGGQEFPLSLDPLPPPDPVPAVERVPAGPPRPLWKGVSLGDWTPEKGSWTVSDPSRKAWVDGEERAQPAASLRGASPGPGSARLDLAPMVKGAEGWRLDWQMTGEGRRSGGAARVEVHFAVRRDGTALVLGIDDQDCYLGRRDPATGNLVRTHRLKEVASGWRHSFSVWNHGDVFVATVDGKRVGAVAVPGDLVEARTIRASVEGGAGYFSDLFVLPLAKP